MNAQTCHTILKRCRTVGPNPIRVVVLDGDFALSLTEEHLDAWWANLDPQVKAEIYELQLGDATERCKFCGCTEDKACEGGCAWLDAHHTVCSAPACAAKHNAELFQATFGPDPRIVIAGTFEDFIAKAADTQLAIEEATHASL